MIKRKLLRYTLKRIIHLIPVLLGVSLITFSLMFIAPGGPEYAILGVEATDEQVEQIREEYGLNDPIHEQYLNWLWDALHLDLGESIIEGQPTAELIAQTLPVSISLALLATAVSLVIGLPAGIISAIRKDEWPDTFARIFAFWGVSIPNFWLGIILIIVVSVWLDLLPIHGYVSFTESPVGWFLHLILPAIALGTALAALVTRMVRSSLLEVLNDDYLTTARAKGVSEHNVIVKHALSNGLIPVITIVGLQLGFVLGGSVLIEIVFNLPGLGRLLIDAVFSRDFPVIQGAVLVYAIIFILVNLLVDLLYAYVDPRITY